MPFSPCWVDLNRITRECERLESRLHHFLKEFEARRATLAAMAKSLIAREAADVIDVQVVN